MSSETSPARKLTVGIMAALGLWGLYLAIGATGMFLQRSLFDARKSGIVLFFVALFLGLWAGVLLHVRRRKLLTDAEPSIGEGQLPVRPAWNPAGLASALLAGLGLFTWTGAVLTWQATSLQATTVMGWSAALLVTVSATAGMVSLSDRSRRRGTWLGLIGLITCLIALIVFVFRMRP